MKRMFMFLAFLSIFITSAAFAGNLDSPSDPSQGSYMYSLDDLYNRLITGEVGTASIPFREATAIPGSTGHNLNDVMAVAPQIHSQGAYSQNVLSNTTFWGLRSGTGWGLLTGTMPDIGQQVVTPGITNQTISRGYHTGSGYALGSTNLIPENIRLGVDLFGVVGTAVVAGGNIVDTSSGTATASDIVAGKRAWVQGVEITGANTSCVACTGTLSAGGRWCDNGDGTVTDMHSGLFWLRDASWGGQMLWDENGNDNAFVRAGILYAGSASANLTDGSGVGDWRLPTLWELQALTSGTEAILLATPQFFSGIQNGNYWSSVSNPGTPANAYIMNLAAGGDPQNPDEQVKTVAAYVWPVRRR